jgi:GNAT superfamily N-acetyltransferase
VTVKLKAINDIISYLKIDEVRNVNILYFMNDYPICYIEKIENSVIVKGTSDRDWIYISSESEEELKTIKGKLKINDNCFAVIEDWMIPILTKGSRTKWKLSTLKLFLPTNVVLPDNKYIVSDLRIEDAKFIYENSDYKEYISIEYIRDRIQKGLSSCIYDSKKLVAWAITQDDGAIGFLHVLSEYRLRGYGRDIIIDITKKVRKQGRVPFAHIEEKNEKSMKLALSLGFKKDRIVNWLEIE